MPLLRPDSSSQKVCYIAVAFGIAALVLTCVGIATPSWHAEYYSTGDGNYVKMSTANFFYACVFYASGTLQNCTNRDSSLYGYSGYDSSNVDPWMTDYNRRMQTAGALCIVGIILLFLGTLATLLMAIMYF